MPIIFAISDCLIPSKTSNPGRDTTYAAEIQLLMKTKKQYNICEQVLEKVAFVATLKEDDGELFYPLGDSC